MASIGVIVGRFQVHRLNDTHIQLINYVWAKHNKVMIFLGCKPGAIDAVNPLSYDSRSQMIRSYYQNMGIQAIPDRSTDEQWSNDLDQMLHTLFPREEIMLYGEVDTFINKYTGKLSTAKLTPTVVVNKTIDREIYSDDFRAGVIYNTNNRYPIVYPTVDVAIVDNVNKMVLLARKPDEAGLRFVGGFVDPNDPTFEYAALREIHEETSFVTAGGYNDKNLLLYLGSFSVPDWRYPNIDKIMTTFFECDRKSNCGGRIAPHDDIVELVWKPLDNTLFDVMMECHIPLAKALLTRKEQE